MSQQIAANLRFGNGASGIAPVDVNQNAAASLVASQAFEIFVYILGVTAIFGLLWAGWQLITAQGNSDNIASARRQIVYSVIGIILAVGAFYIFNAARSVAQNATSIQDHL